MSQLLADWHKRKQREDEQLHDQLRGAVLGGRVQVFTDTRVLDFPGSPVHHHWDHLLPLTGLMTLALIILLAAGVAVGIVVMTLCVLAHVFGHRYFLSWRLNGRARDYLVKDMGQFLTLWQMGGVALVVKGGSEPPCLAPKGDWRKFIRRNLGEGEAPKPRDPAALPPPPEAQYHPPPSPPPPPMDAVIPSAPEAEVLEPGGPRTHWESIEDEPAHDHLIPPNPPPS